MPRLTRMQKRSRPRSRLQSRTSCETSSQQKISFKKKQVSESFIGDSFPDISIDEATQSTSRQHLDSETEVLSQTDNHESEKGQQQNQTQQKSTKRKNTLQQGPRRQSKRIRRSLIVSVPNIHTKHNAFETKKVTSTRQQHPTSTADPNSNLYHPPRGQLQQLHQSGPEEWNQSLPPS